VLRPLTITTTHRLTILRSIPYDDPTIPALPCDRIDEIMNLTLHLAWRHQGHPFTEASTLLRRQSVLLRPRQLQREQQPQHFIFWRRLPLLQLPNQSKDLGHLLKTGASYLSSTNSAPRSGSSSPLVLEVEPANNVAKDGITMSILSSTRRRSVSRKKKPLNNSTPRSDPSGPRLPRSFLVAVCLHL
jgi:hypothetical protein